MGSFLSVRARRVRSIVVVLVLTGLLVSGLIPAPMSDAAAQTNTTGEEVLTDGLPSTREELTGLRTRNVKVFEEPDGGRTAEIYAEPVHFESDSGRWLEIDSGLVASDRPGYAFENRRGAFAVEFSATAKESGMVRVQSGNAILSFGVAGANRASRAVVTADRLTYPGIFSGVDLVFEVTPEGLKEFVVLTTRPAKPLSVRFPFSLQGVRPKELASGDISFIGGDGRSAFALPRGWMFDSSGSERTEPAVSDAVNFDLDLKSRQPAITLTPDSRWLADPARVYPIMVDPTVETLNPSPDCYITGGANADTTHCSDAALRVGWDTSMRRRGLLKFPVEQLPDGAYVTDADLKLYLTDSSTTQSAPIEIHRLTSSWGGGVTWKRRTWDNQNLWGAQGGDFTSFVWATRGVSGSSAGYKAWDVTSLVREWRKADGSPNYGMILKQDTESVNNLLQFATNQSPESQWPKLVVHYGSVTMDVAEWNANTTTGQTSYNFSVSASGLNFAGDPAGPCYNTNCTWKVETRYTDGTEEVSMGTLETGFLESNPASFTKTFTGTLSHEVTHIRTQVISARCSCFASHAWYDYDSGWIKVSDPYPDGSVSLGIGNWLRDATTNQVEYSLTVSGGGAGQFGGPCAENSCRWSVDVRYEDGSTSELGNGDLDRGTWNFAENLNGATTFSKKVTDLRAVLRSKCSLGGGYWCWNRHETYTTDWIPVSDHIYKNNDIAAGAAALGPVLTRNPTAFCTRFLVWAGTHHLRSTLTDQYWACEAAAAATEFTITKVLLGILDAPGPAIIPDFDPDPFPLPDSTVPPVRQDWEDETGCKQNIPEESLGAIRDHVELDHGYSNADPNSPDQDSYWAEDVPWEDLVYPYAMRFKARPGEESDSCVRVIPYDAPVGYERDYSSSGPWAFHLTSTYTVVTSMSTGWLRTAHPGLPRENQ